MMKMIGFKNRYIYFWIVIVIILLQGCKVNEPTKTYAEEIGGYVYIPVEPSKVNINCDCNESIQKEELLKALPDNSIRMSIRNISFDSNIKMPLGIAIGMKNNTYEVIIDFVNTQTINQKFVGKWVVDVSSKVQTSSLNKCYPYESSLKKQIHNYDDYEIWNLIVLPLKDKNKTIESDDNLKKYFRCKNTNKTFKDNYVRTNFESFVVPVYVGIGLRLKAKIYVIEDNVRLSSLSEISMAAKNHKIFGSLSIQTLGINGKSIQNRLIFPTKLDETSIQNAIQSLASIKASIFDEDVSLTPRIVGFQNTINAPISGINQIYSYLVDSNISLTLKHCQKSKKGEKK